MDNWAGNGEAAELFERFVEDIAGIEVGSDENIGTPLQRTFGSLFGGDSGIYSGVELHLAVDEPIGVGLPNLIDDLVDFGEIRVFATGAIGGVGKHGDLGLLVVINLESGGSVLDDGVELFSGGEFVDATVGKGEVLCVVWSIAFTDETAGEIFGFKREVVFVSEEDVTRRIVEAGNHRVGISLAQYFGGVIKTISGDKLEVREVLGGFLCNGVSVEFGEDDFHRIIIT